MSLWPAPLDRAVEDELREDLAQRVRPLGRNDLVTFRRDDRDRETPVSKRSGSVDLVTKDGSDRQPRVHRLERPPSANRTALRG